MLVILQRDIPPWPHRSRIGTLGEKADITGFENSGPVNLPKRSISPISSWGAPVPEQAMADQKPQQPQKGRLQFNYIKGPTYREIPCDGVLGGRTPHGLLWMSIYSERTPI